MRCNTARIRHACVGQQHNGHQALAHDPAKVRARHQLLAHVAPLAEADPMEAIQIVLQRYCFACPVKQRCFGTVTATALAVMVACIYNTQSTPVLSSCSVQLHW